MTDLLNDYARRSDRVNMLLELQAPEVIVIYELVILYRTMYAIEVVASIIPEHN